MVTAKVLPDWLQTENKYRWSGGAFSLLAFGLALAACLPSWRLQLRKPFESGNRVVLSTVSGPISINSRVEFTIAKIRIADALFLEVYQNISIGERRLVDKIQLPDHHDAYFNFNGHASNLALRDVDGTGRIAILAPTFDDNLNGKLNVFRYDDDLKVFKAAAQ